VESSEINIPVLLIAGEKEASIGAEHAFFAPFCFQNKIFLPRQARDNHKGKVETTRRFL
jgi:hypothetical protein